MAKEKDPKSGTVIRCFVSTANQNMLAKCSRGNRWSIMLMYTVGSVAGVDGIACWADGLAGWVDAVAIQVCPMILLIIILWMWVDIIFEPILLFCL